MNAYIFAPVDNADYHSFRFFAPIGQRLRRYTTSRFPFDTSLINQMQTHYCHLIDNHQFVLKMTLPALFNVVDLNNGLALCIANRFSYSTDGMIFLDPVTTIPSAGAKWASHLPLTFFSPTTNEAVNEPTTAYRLTYHPDPNVIITDDYIHMPFYFDLSIRWSTAYCSSHSSCSLFLGQQ